MTIKDDRRKLAHFYIELHSTIPEIINGKYFNFTEEAQKHLSDAWYEYYSDTHGNQISKQNVLNEINKISNDDLQIHGLYGKQLNLKLWAIEWSKKRFLKDKTHSRFRKWIENIDNLLDSFLSSAPWWGTALKEIKDALLGVSDDEFPDEIDISDDDTPPDGDKANPLKKSDTRRNIRIRIKR